MKITCNLHVLTRLLGIWGRLVSPSMIDSTDTASTNLLIPHETALPKHSIKCWKLNSDLHLLQWNKAVALAKVSIFSWFIIPTYCPCNQFERSTLHIQRNNRHSCFHISHKGILGAWCKFVFLAWFRFFSVAVLVLSPEEEWLTPRISVF